MKKTPKIGATVSIVEDGKKVKGKVKSYTLDRISCGSLIVEKKYWVKWEDGRTTKEHTGLFYDRKTSSLEDIWNEK